MMTQAIAAASLLGGILSLYLNWRHRSGLGRVAARLRDDMDHLRRDCLQQIGHVGEGLATLERSAQTSAELLQDGRLSIAGRARALRMLRSGMSSDSAAIELGMSRSDVRLLEKVAVLLSPRI
jgi:hypothetical protein